MCVRTAGSAEAEDPILDSESGVMPDLGCWFWGGREFVGVFLFVVFLVLLVLPFFTTLLLIWRGHRRRLRVLHLIAWTLAALLSLLLALSMEPELRSAMWGTWLYVGVAGVALALELRAPVAESGSG